MRLRDWPATVFGTDRLRRSAATERLSVLLRQSDRLLAALRTTFGLGVMRMLILTRAAASVIAAIALALLAAGCGDVESGTAVPLPTVTPGVGYPLRVQLGNGRELAIPAPPQRILLANAYLVDVVTRLVSAERVVALPGQAKTWTRLVDVDDGFRAKARFRTIDLERAASFEPDLVLCSPFNVALAGAR